VLALDLYLRRGMPPQNDPELVRLSELLNRLRGGISVPDEAHFRNPNGVHMKLGNFRGREKPGAGLPHGNQLELQIWERFKNRPDALETEVKRIKEKAEVG
jgi:hypothetical protein